MKTVFFTLSDKLRTLIRFVLGAGFIALSFYQFNDVSEHTITFKVIAFAVVGLAYLVYGVAGWRNWRK